MEFKKKDIVVIRAEEDYQRKKKVLLWECIISTVDEETAANHVEMPHDNVAEVCTHYRQQFKFEIQIVMRIIPLQVLIRKVQVPHPMYYS